MRLSHIYFQIFVTFAIKLHINPYLAGSDYRLMVRTFLDDEVKEAVHDKFCTVTHFLLRCLERTRKTK